MLVVIHIVRLLKRLTFGYELSSSDSKAAEMAAEGQVEGFDLDGTIENLRESYPPGKSAGVPVDIVRAISGHSKRR